MNLNFDSCDCFRFFVVPLQVVDECCKLIIIRIIDPVAGWIGLNAAIVAGTASTLSPCLPSDSNYQLVCKSQSYAGDYQILRAVSVCLLHQVSDLSLPSQTRPISNTPSCTDMRSGNIRLRSQTASSSARWLTALVKSRSWLGLKKVVRCHSLDSSKRAR